MSNLNLCEQVKKRCALAMDAKGLDPRKVVLATYDEQICGIFRVLLPEEFELYDLRDVNFCGALPKNRGSLVDEAIERAREVHKFMRDRGETCTVVGEATALKIDRDGEKQPTVYRRPENTEGNILANLGDDPEHKAILSCVLAVIPAGESEGAVWTCAGAAHGKIADQWGGMRLWGQARYSILEGHFAVDKLDGRTLAETTIDEYTHYSHYVRAILHMLERFPYGY